MSRAKGDEAEERACGYLVEHGFAILERNFYSRFGEVDIIALKEGVLHFVEVKSGIDYESAVQNLTKRKLSRVIKTADVYMKKNCISVDFSIDALIVIQKEIEFLENITL